MNAVESACTLDWRSSSAFDSTLATTIDPKKLYKFNSQVVMDQSFRERLRKAPKDVFLESGLPDLSDQLDPEMIDGLALSEEEAQAIKEISMLNAVYGRTAGVAIDNAAADQGYGMPAVAAVALVVWLAVYLFVFVIAAEQDLS